MTVILYPWDILDDIQFVLVQGYQRQVTTVTFTGFRP